MSGSFHQSSGHKPGIRARLEQQAIESGLAPKSKRQAPSRPECGAGGRASNRLARLRAVMIFCIGLLGSMHIHAQTEWGLQINGQSQARLALGTTIDIEVTGLTARVLVMQDFNNPVQDWAEGTYRFPLPDGAAVDALFIKVGDRLVEGEIREREDARRVYQQARQAGSAAGLVEQEQGHRFTTRVANIGPGENIQIMIGFLMPVSWQDGSFGLRLPMTFVPRHGHDDVRQMLVSAPGPSPLPAAQLPERNVQIQVRLLDGSAIGSIKSRYHDVAIETLPEGYRVSLADTQTPPDRDFELNWQPVMGEHPAATLSTWQGEDAVYAQLMLVPPLPEAMPESVREVIFVVDTSGSMEGESLDQAKATLLRAIDQLKPDDSFNVIEFNSSSSALFGRPVHARQQEKQAAIGLIRGFKAQGGTEMAPALDLAFAQPAMGERLRQVVFITDGGTSNERELLELIAAKLGTARLFTVGIGAAPNTRFMRKAAEIGRGKHTLISGPQDVAERMDTLWGKIRQPAMTDLCIDWGLPADSYPLLIPDLYAGEPLWLHAKLPGVPGEVSLCGRFNGQEWWQVIQPEVVQSSATLATLWAHSKVEALEDTLMFGADAQMIQAEVTELALDYQLLTTYTSLVAVDKTPMRPSQSSLRRDDLPSLLPAGTAQASVFPATATGWRTQLALSLLVLLISGSLLLRPDAPLNSVHIRKLLASLIPTGQR